MGRLEAIKAKNLSIDATRGKPNMEQVALCQDMLAPLDNFKAEDGTDVRNYGGSEGIPEMKRVFGEMLDLTPGEIIVGSNSSLHMMFDTISTLILTGAWDRSRIKFLCPSPGYDRHFAICEYFGIKMITVPMTPDGPDMDMVEELAKDPDVAGMWCVPVFSNPQGYIYSDDIIRRLAAIPTANPTFRILWDNAYTVHNFTGTRPMPVNILRECEKNGHGNRPVIFTSFSKISLAGGGVVCMAGSKSGLAPFRKRIAAQTIGPDKVNQLRHARYFKNLAGVEAHMEKHAKILAPKFQLVLDTFGRELAGTEATFTSPRGGYFVSVETPPGTAKAIRQLCKDAGVLLTDAGATFPYGVDPNDTNIRFAPTFLSMEELEQALEVFCLAVKSV